MPPSPFALVIFEISSHFLSGLAWNMMLLYMLPEVAGITGVLHHANRIIDSDGISRTICLGWSQTLILPILVSQIARIIGVNPQHQIKFTYFLISTEHLLFTHMYIYVYFCFFPTNFLVTKMLRLNNLVIFLAPFIESLTESSFSKSPAKSV
jgi:hypothetical protein